MPVPVDECPFGYIAETDTNQTVSEAPHTFEVQGSAFDQEHQTTPTEVSDEEIDGFIEIGNIPEPKSVPNDAFEAQASAFEHQTIPIEVNDESDEYIDDIPPPKSVPQDQFETQESAFHPMCISSHVPIPNDDEFIVDIDDIPQPKSILKQSVRFSSTPQRNRSLPKSRGEPSWPPSPPIQTNVPTVNRKPLGACRDGYLCKNKQRCTYAHPCNHGWECRSLKSTSVESAEHVRKFTHPCVLGTSCPYQDTPDHQADHLQHMPSVPQHCRNGLSCNDANCTRLHPCKKGPTCDYLLLDSQHINHRQHTHSCSHPCRHGDMCPFFKEGRNSNDQNVIAHNALNTHTPTERVKPKCKFAAECRLTTDPTHMGRYTHPCRHGPDCRLLQRYSNINPKTDPKDAKQLTGHIQSFVHPCPAGTLCPNKRDECHAAQFTHDMPVQQGATKPPKEWKSMKNDYEEHQVDPKTAEYQVIAKRYGESMTTNIVKIVRVQNVLLWNKHYSATEFLKKKKCNNGQPNYHYLFHGCRNAATAKIITTSGFSIQQANSNPYGIWFANAASYSCGGYQWQEDGCNCVFVAKVAVGTEGTDDGSGRRCGKLTGGELADTHIVQQKCKVFVVYNDDLCYPAYKLFFK